MITKSSGIQPQMTQTQRDQFIQKIYDLVDAHHPSPNLNDDLIEELITAFEDIFPVTVK